MQTRAKQYATWPHSYSLFVRTGARAVRRMSRGKFARAIPTPLIDHFSSLISHSFDFISRKHIAGICEIREFLFHDRTYCAWRDAKNLFSSNFLSMFETLF